MKTLELPRIYLPTTREVLELTPGDLHWTERGKRYLEQLERGPIAGAASMSDYLENKIADHITGKTSYTAPSFYLALCTATPDDTKTGATITEANYTGYARLNIAGASWSAASAGETHNSGTQTFAACTAGSSTIIGLAGCDASGTGAGNLLVWTTCSSTVISTTQTPATVAASGFSITVD